MLKVAVVILIVMHVFAGFVALMAFIAPKMMLKSTYKAMTGNALDSVQDADFLKVVSNRQSKVGFYALTTVVFCFFVLIAGFRKAQKWAWWCLLIVAGVTWLEGLISYIIIGSLMYILIYAIGTVLLFVGVLLPVKEFFAKTAEQPEEAEAA